MPIQKVKGGWKSWEGGSKLKTKKKATQQLKAIKASQTKSKKK